MFRTYAYAHCDAYSYAYAHRDAYSYAYPDAHPYPNCDANRHANSFV